MEDAVYRVINIPVEELAIDKLNIRCGLWDCDDELINNVRHGGIRNPLLVRPISGNNGIKYGIVCGSRRYNASIEAGLSFVPCIIQEMTDIEAMRESMSENRLRKDTPLWMDIEFVGRMYEIHRTDGLSHNNAINLIANTGISLHLIDKYIRIYSLPFEVKGLLRDPEERERRQKECISLFRSREPTKLLKVGHAYLLHQLINLPLDKQMETALFINDHDVEKAESLVQLVKTNPTTRIDELYQQLIKKYGEPQSRKIKLEKVIIDALAVVCMEYQISFDNLLKKIIKEWLITKGYLPKFSFLKDNGVDIKTKSRVNEKILSEVGYKFVINDGDSRVYQKSVKGTSGFIKIHLYNNGMGIFKITPGAYDEEEERQILMAERERIGIFQERFEGNIQTMESYS